MDTSDIEGVQPQSLEELPSSHQTKTIPASTYWTSIDKIPQSKQDSVRVFPGKKVHKVLSSTIQLLDQIGEGGQGVVYNANFLWQQSKEEESMSSAGDCAAKKFKGEVHNNLFGQWPEELFGVHAMCNYVCHFYGYCNDGDAFCLLMYKYDCSLRNNIDKQMKKGTYKGRPFHGPIALSIIIQIAIGMTFLHQLNIIHRDLKADNILVMYMSKDDDTPAGVFIADFDVAPTVIGTTFWRAPEILQALRENRDLYNTGSIDTIVYEASKKALPFTTKSDVYSFGMLCYEIITGLIPFEGTNFSDYDVVLSGGRPKLPTNLNPRMVDLLNRCWHHDPIARPTFKEIVVELKGFVEGTDALMMYFNLAKSYLNIDPTDHELSILELKQLVYVLVEKYNQEEFVVLTSELVNAIEQFKVQFGMQSFKEHPSLPFYEGFSRMVLVNTISLKRNLFMASCPQVLPEFARICSFISSILDETILHDMFEASASHGNSIDMEENITEGEMAKRMDMYKAFSVEQEIHHRSSVYVNRHEVCHELLTNKHHIGREHDEIQPCALCKTLPFYAPRSSDSKICTFKLYTDKFATLKSVFALKQ